MIVACVGFEKFLVEEDEFEVIEFLRRAKCVNEVYVGNKYRYILTDKRILTTNLTIIESSDVMPAQNSEGLKKNAAEDNNS